MPNLELTCIWCGDPFIFTEGEQEHFKKYELSTPKRCVKCRMKKKAIIEQRQKANGTEE